MSLHLAEIFPVDTPTSCRSCWLQGRAAAYLLSETG